MRDKLDLSTLGLSQEAIEARVNGIGGSDANIIMGGDPEKLLRLWEMKTGRRPNDDLSDQLNVVMGQFTEPLNIAWFEKNTSWTVELQAGAITSETEPHRFATLDGWVMDFGWTPPGDGERTKVFDTLGIFEAKHTNTGMRDYELLAMYQPQLHHNMAVTGMDRAWLSILKGNGDWCYFEVAEDPAYAAQLREAEWDFWMAVQSDEPPVPYPLTPTPAAENFKATRVADFTGDNTWAAAANDWLLYAEAAKAFEAAKTTMKGKVDADVARAFGHGVEINRASNGSLRFKAL